MAGGTERDAGAFQTLTLEARQPPGGTLGVLAPANGGSFAQAAGDLLRFSVRCPALVVWAPWDFSYSLR